ncbi:probable leucine-rich repeat receptor-like protein kinase At1g35710 [Setaria italica]|uniref:probable leucine-rich repeat receptor-like protein kinase At1g35710 n=1 Tax=Setaria italica TaxID=4555 RepID=UPI000BE52812|nr:probable leucine-rich repeat receptor-like protein kinase At1g35710 [Setaria italica]
MNDIGGDNIRSAGFESNLRELYLDSVDLSNSGEEWGTSLAAYVPQLQVLSLADCHLSGPIHKALSRLHSLVVIKLQENFYEPSGRPFPEFFMDFPNLTVLQLSQTDLEGPLPSRPFQSKNLRVLDLSYNMNLSGHVPNFSNASSLETLRLDGTNLVYDIPTPSSNFTSLKELGLKRNLISMDFLSAFGRLESLHQLDLDCFLDNELDHDLDSGSDLGPIFSWIGQHKNLTSLGLFGCNFSGAVGNLTGLQTLAMDDCTTYGSMPSSIGNLTNLRNLHILSTFSGPMPAAIGGLTNLRNLYIKDVGFSGPMPAAIGELTNLRNLYIEDVGFSGPMPPAIGKLTNLRNMYIEHSGFSGSMPAPIGNSQI